MKVKIQAIGLFSLSRAVGSASWDFEFWGDTLADLINALVASYGQGAREELLNAQGEGDENILLIINGTTVKFFENHHLNEGDEICLMLPLVGG